MELYASLVVSGLVVTKPLITFIVHMHTFIIKFSNNLGIFKKYSEIHIGKGAALQPYKYGGKEEVSLSFLDFHARPYDPATLLFWTPDQHREKYIPFHSQLYCVANPINFTDPTGMTVEGVSKDDAKRIVQDIREMFPSDEFSDFRELIVQSIKAWLQYQMNLVNKRSQYI